ncbi:MAG TPA: hypothetical protein VNP73_09035 [Actinomycetota bacterium]|nr:hypothetical protein [Actinomycetota bacterium]
MSLAAPAPALQRFRSTAFIFLSLAGVAAALTSLFLGMRAVMEIGGACAEGGPFVPVRPCPRGAPGFIVGGIWGGLISCAIYAWQSFKNKVPSLVAFAWPALFLSLGWNFFEYGFNPPFGEGWVWGWLICGVVFFLMGGLPLLVILSPTVRNFDPNKPTDAELNRTLSGPRIVRDKLFGREAQPVITTEPPPVQGWFWLIVQFGAIAGGIWAAVWLYGVVTG